MQPNRLKQLTDTWALLSYYQRFEGLVALALTFLVGLIIVIALFRLTMGVMTDLVFNALNPLDHAVFQTVFGEIMTLLIALLALSRKFILLDLKAVSPAQLLALAGATLALGLTYWLIRSSHGAGNA